MRNIINRLYFTRNIEGDELIENFLVSAVATVLLTRFYLEITGYPQIGRGVFHIAHVVFGGIFMMIALILIIGYLNSSVKYFSAILGGIGFGLFIDELGKFITSDNNYFFQPTAALVYMIFVLLYLFLRTFEKGRVYTKKEYLLNSIEMLKEMVLNDMDPEEKSKAIEYLEKSDQRKSIVHSLRELIERADTVEEYNGPFASVRKRLRTIYHRLINNKYFVRFLIVFFLFVSALNIIICSILVLDYQNLTFSELGRIISSLLAGAFVIIGSIYLKSNRLRAYEMYKRSVLITIFITQFFLFYIDQFSAVIGLLANIFILLVLDYLINQERARIFQQRENKAA